MKSSDLGRYAVAHGTAADQTGAGAATAIATDATGANGILAQALTVAGYKGSTTIANTSITNGKTAYDVANLVNDVTSSTGVSATAKSEATLSVGAAGNVSFKIGTGTTNLQTITADVTTATDLTGLVNAINDVSGKTGITAEKTSTGLKLFQSEGKDIRIGDATNTTTTGDITVTGLAGASAVLDVSDSTKDSTVVTGVVEFSSQNAFSVSSTIEETAGSVLDRDANQLLSSTAETVDTIDIESQANAQKAIDIIDKALGKIDSQRGDLGAIQNRFETTIANLQNITENISAARSRILDADIAQETSNMTKQNILAQAGVSILAQANQSPQLALSLLQ
jgi:flagellin